MEVHVLESKLWQSRKSSWETQTVGNEKSFAITQPVRHMSTIASESKRIERLWLQAEYVCDVLDESAWRTESCIMYLIMRTCYTDYERYLSLASSI